MDVEAVKQMSRWKIHDLVAGFLAGTGVGLVAAIFIIARVIDHRMVMIILIALGAGGGIYLADRYGSDDGGITPWRVINWTLFVLSYGFVLLLVIAIRGLS